MACVHALSGPLLRINTNATDLNQMSNENTRKTRSQTTAAANNSEAQPVPLMPPPYIPTASPMTHTSLLGRSPSVHSQEKSGVSNGHGVSSHASAAIEASTERIREEDAREEGQEEKSEGAWPRAI